MKFKIGIACAFALTCLNSGGVPSAIPARQNKEVVHEFRWNAIDKASVSEAKICPLLFDKTWAYSLEIDDGPVSALAVTQPLLATRFFTDAPPGIKGGKRLPFVGGIAVIAKSASGNSSTLSWDQIRTLEAAGWEVLNHGYWHAGNSWEPKAAMSEAQVENELYWSQAVMAAESLTHRQPTHMVYPNGYMAYKPFLEKYGIRSASRVAGKKFNMSFGGDKLDIDRNYLDESVWSKAEDVLVGFPDKVGDEQFMIDFTHGMDADPESANHKRWVKRLDALSNSYGEKNYDNIWCAPTSAVIRYREAARHAFIRLGHGLLQVRVEAEYADSPITIQLLDIPESDKMTAPSGGSLYRKGTTVWVTFPAPPRSEFKPKVKCVFSCPSGVAEFEQPIRFAGVRVYQTGGKAIPVKVQLIGVNGGIMTLTDETLAPAWGVWQLFSLSPMRPPMYVKEVRVSPNPGLTKMEVWAESEGGGR
ncbi:MAG: polysaccharide deacetylase family protein [Chthonomonadales bacterium]